MAVKATFEYDSSLQRKIRRASIRSGCLDTLLISEEHLILNNNYCKTFLSPVFTITNYSLQTSATKQSLLQG